MVIHPPAPEEYARFLADLTRRIRAAQLRTASTVNTELLRLYWQIGKAIVDKQEKAGWGDAVIARLSSDLLRDYPCIKGFSRRNLFYIRQWYMAYRDADEKVQQLVALIPWSHNILIANKLRDHGRRVWYLQQTLQHGWSRKILTHQVESELYERQALPGKTHNFARSLPPAQSELAAEMLKDPYHLDFLALGPDIRETELERALVDHLQEFLLELGVGFAFVGRQYRIKAGSREYAVDLLFYHLRLRSLVAFDLKMQEFQPEDSGKMNFYLSALDDLVKHPDDRPSIGIILCKSKDRTTVEYALRDTSKPIGVAAYRLTHSLPCELQESLPNLAQIEREFRIASTGGRP